MRMHLDKCPHRYRPKTFCGHCELTVNDWRVMVEQLNVKGKLSDAPCNPKYKVVSLRKPTFPEKPMVQQSNVRQKLGKGVKLITKSEQTPRKYNSWTTCDPILLDTLCKEVHMLQKEKIWRKQTASAPGRTPVEPSPGDVTCLHQ